MSIQSISSKVFGKFFAAFIFSFWVLAPMASDSAPAEAGAGISAKATGQSSIQASVDVQGHRGARSRRPENTLAAFQYALEKGVTTLELDLAVTKDQVLVISHDPLIPKNLCLTSEGKPVVDDVVIHFLNLKEVQGFDCGTLKNSRFPDQVPVKGEKIPTLEHFFELIKNSDLAIAKTVKFNIETKIFPAHPDVTPRPEEFSRLIIELVKKYGFTSRVIIQSFDERTLLAAKKIEPKIKTALLTYENRMNYLAAVKAAKADILSPNHEWILPEDISKLRKAGIPVIPWTVNKASDWKRMLDLQVDGIITDDPEALIQFLKENQYTIR